MKSSRPAALLCLFLIAAVPSFATTWNVGPTRTYTMPSTVVGLVKEGDTVLIDAGTYRDVQCVWTVNLLTFIGIGTVVLLPETTQMATSTWTLAGMNYTVRNIEFRNGVERSEGGVGLLVTGQGCTVDSCVFARNRGGVKFAQDGPSSPLVYASLFEENEDVDVEAASVQYLTVLRCWFRGSANAVNIRSSASFHNITLNLFTDERGASLTTIDLQRGGYTQMYGNIFHGARVVDSLKQDAKHFIRYATDVAPYPDWTHHLECAWNTFVNDVDSIAFIESTGTLAATLEIKNNLFAGKGIQIQDTTDSGRVTIDTAGNFADSTVDSVGFVDASKQNYHLTAWSPVRDHWQSPHIQQMLVEYKHPRQERPRPGGGINVGAFDYEEPPPTPRTWQVGWGRSSGTPGDVCRRVHDGDTVLIDSGEYVDGTCEWSANDLTIIGLGKVVIRSNGGTSFQNALWEILAGRVYIEGIEFRDRVTIDGRGAGLVIFGGDVTLRSCTFARLQRGIVFDPKLLVARLTIEQCAFEGLGAETASPVIDCGAIQSLSITGSYFHNAGSSALVRSDAHSNFITACRADVADLSLQPAFDFPSGGFVQLSGTNVRAKGGGAENEIVRYGSGVVSDARDNRLFVGYNTIVNDGNATRFVNATTTRLKSIRVINNLLVGDGLQSVGQARDETNTASNQYIFSISDAGFADAATMDYRISDTSPARLAAVPTGFQPPTSYVHPHSTTRRTSWYDAGAYESLRTADVDDVVEDHTALLIAPNPASASVTLTLPPSLIGHDVVIMNMHGSEVARFTATHTTLQTDVRGLASGMYIARCGGHTTLFAILP